MHSAVTAHSSDPIAASRPFADWDIARAAVSGGVVDSVAEPRGGRALAATTTQRPAYAASDANFAGRPSSTGDLTDDRLLTDAGTLADWKFLHDGSGMELMVVMRRGGASTLRPQLHTMGGTLVNVGATLLVNNAGTVQVSIGNGTVTLQVNVGGAIGAGQTRVIGARYKETTSPRLSVYAGGIEVGTAAAWPSSGVPSSGNPTKGLTVGNYRDTYNESNGAPWARLLIWNRELTSTERARIAARLASLYGAV